MKDGTERKRSCLIYGDSLTYGYLPNDAHQDLRLPVEERYTTMLEQAFPEVHFSIHAKVGRCIPYLPFEWEDFKEACKGFTKEDFLIVFLGVNDFLSYGRPDISRVVSRLKEFLEDFPKEGIPFIASHILYICPPILDFRGDKFYEPFSTMDGKLDEALVEYCKEAEISCFNTEELSLEKFPDGMHLTGEAQKKLGDSLCRFLQACSFFKVIPCVVS